MKSLVPLIGTFLIVCSVIVVRRSYLALAKKYDKLPIGYTSLGLGVYFGGFVIMACVLAALGGYIGKGYAALHLAAMWGFACFCAWMVYSYLKSSLEAGNPKNDDLLDR